MFTIYSYYLLIFISTEDIIWVNLMWTFPSILNNKNSIEYHDSSLCVLEDPIRMYYLLCSVWFCTVFLKCMCNLWLILCGWGLSDTLVYRNVVFFTSLFFNVIEIELSFLTHFQAFFKDDISLWYMISYVLIMDRGGYSMCIYPLPYHSLGTPFLSVCIFHSVWKRQLYFTLIFLWWMDR